MSKGTQDAFYGRGVYFTQMNPFEDQFIDILINNWGCEPKKRIDVCLKFSILSSRMKNVGGHKRNVHLYGGKDLDNLGKSHLTAIYCLNESLAKIVEIIEDAQPSWLFKQVCSCTLLNGMWKKKKKLREKTPHVDGKTKSRKKKDSKKSESEEESESESESESEDSGSESESSDEDKCNAIVESTGLVCNRKLPCQYHGI
jgi:hypothetical protein